MDGLAKKIKQKDLDMSYQYDVFLSYSRTPTQAQWVNEIFLQLFRDFLTDAVNIRELRIFQDTEAIGSSDAWPERIRNALAHSKSMVCIWSPAYFNSEWCLREFAAMRHREQELSLRSLSNPAGLVSPLKIFDGEFFPDYTTSYQCEDYRNFFRVGEAFTKTPPYCDFQTSLQNWVVKVADVIRNAPAWSADWLTPAWLDEPYVKLPKPAPLHARRPTL